MPIVSLVSGLIGQGGAQAAAGAYGQAGQNADFIRRQNEAKFSPYYSSGVSAQNLLSGLLGLGHYVQDGQGYGGQILNDSNWKQDQTNAFARFQASPDYNFRFGEGLKALDRSAASRGNLFSGRQMKAAQDYGGNLASSEYGNWFNRLAGVGNQGLSAAGSIAQSNLEATKLQNQALAGQAGAYQQGANALASGVGNAANSVGSLLGYFGGFGGSSGGVNALSPSATMSAYNSMPSWWTRPGMQGI